MSVKDKRAAQRFEKKILNNLKVAFKGVNLQFEVLLPGIAYLTELAVRTGAALRNEAS